MVASEVVERKSSWTLYEAFNYKPAPAPPGFTICSLGTFSNGLELRVLFPGLPDLWEQWKMINKPIDTSLLTVSHDTRPATLGISGCLKQIHALCTTTCVADIYHFTSDECFAAARHAFINPVTSSYSQQVCGDELPIACWPDVCWDWFAPADSADM